MIFYQSRLVAGGNVPFTAIPNGQHSLSTGSLCMYCHGYCIL